MMRSIWIHYTCAVDTDQWRSTTFCQIRIRNCVRDPDLGSEKPCYWYSKIGTRYRVPVGSSGISEQFLSQVLRLSRLLGIDATVINSIMDITIITIIKTVLDGTGVTDILVIQVITDITVITFIMDITVIMYGTGTVNVSKFDNDIYFDSAHLDNDAVALLLFKLAILF